jgi:hypothetical protein
MAYPICIRVAEYVVRFFNPRLQQVFQPPPPQLFTGEMTLKTEKEILDAEKGVECIQNICLSEKSTECVCPKCGARHRVKLLWTGRGLPRKFCPICKHYSNSINDADPCGVSSVTV